MGTAIAIFIISLVLLVLSSELFVKSAVHLAKALHISPLIIGITIVALGTSLPELMVSGVSTLMGDSGLALGNLLGSNVSNVLLVLAVGILFGKIRIGTAKTQKNIAFLAASTIVFVLVFQLVSSPHVRGAALLGLSLFVSYMEYHWSQAEKTKLQIARVKPHLVALTILAILGILVGGVLSVYSVEALSRLSGLSTTLLGLSVVAVATSLPELFATIFADKEKQEKLVVGNIIGSNVYNLVLIGGLVSLSSAPVSISILSWAWLIVATFAIIVILKIYSGKVIPKKVGIMLLLLFIVYLVTEVS